MAAIIQFNYPLIITVWLVAQLFVTTWDFTFVLLRPRTMKGGDLFAFWAPYDLYIQVDKSYGQLDNGFVIAQSIMNIVEITLVLIGLVRRKSFDGFLLILSASLMSFSKTVLYMLVDICGGFEFTAHNDWFTFITLYFLPSFVWIVFPAIVLIWGYGILKGIYRAAVEQQKTK
ncbi:hypothetical protein FDP41_002632 [Naegleria fowleri]|uniref:EXPERA domain-containing protein n=1 Tax=Naegleria fowleri TaxID=5763 RepID=A0A6A5BM57_NAEFO|nr:uncharacterized protein FDP41_002632 [Naegleria fowleri]KAF0978117.1 hypothetical protein FDP41_002632 [Naegleria fowleri]